MDRDGYVKVLLDMPGLGIHIEVERIEKLTVRKEMVG